MLYVYAAILAVGVNLAHAQYGFDCYGAHYPNWDDCESPSIATFDCPRLT
jgi:hypothetical protein